MDGRKHLTRKAAALLQLSTVSEHKGDLPEARDRAEQALKVFQQKRDRSNEVYALRQLANLSRIEEPWMPMAVTT